MQKWEYLRLSENPTKASGKDLNTPGAEGWELVGVYALAVYEIVFVFKRPLAD